MKSKWVGIAALLSCATLPLASRGGTQDEVPEFKNLKVLPSDIKREELSEIMLGMLRGLGLRRRAGMGCLHCHVGSFDVPRDTWDYASDKKLAKRQARVMLAMTREINGGYIDRLPGRAESAVDVTCFTCHAGRINPTPLAELLHSKYAAVGIDAVEDTYRDLRGRYYASDAYDFRSSTLIDVANRLANEGRLDDAARVHALNAEHNDDPAALGGEILVRMEQALADEGIEAMVTRYHALKRDHAPQAFRPLLLDPLAWRFFRGGKKEAGLRLFELNYEEYPTSFVAVEDLSWGSRLSGDAARAIELAQTWVEANPDHESGLRLLSEVRAWEDD